MKVGILTLHSQLNYGGVLQAYALQETVKSLGHDVTIIDRAMFRKKGNFRGILDNRSVIDWVNFIGRGLLGFGDFADLKRRLNTNRFINRVLNLSPYSFFTWNEAPKSLGVDILVVGSDQVWNPTDPNVLSTHLLEGAPKIKAISYAASFGIKQIPAELVTQYHNGLARFKQISVRESEGEKLVNVLGYKVAKVLDPVLLADTKIWNKISTNRENKSKSLFCYFLSQKIEDVHSSLLEFAHAQNASVRVFTMEGCIELPPSIRDSIKIPVTALKQRFSRLKLMRAATPDEFVSAIRSSTWVITDSFHALAFSLLFKKNVRVLRPTDEFRKGMFSRIEETVANYLTGPAISNSCHDALASFTANEKTIPVESRLCKDRSLSLAWLKNALTTSYA